jgi:hypothetical protein
VSADALLDPPANDIVMRCPRVPNISCPRMHESGVLTCIARLQHVGDRHAPGQARRFEPLKIPVDWP